jgi:hypothetical protein
MSKTVLIIYPYPEKPNPRNPISINFFLFRR